MKKIVALVLALVVAVASIVSTVSIIAGMDEWDDTNLAAIAEICKEWEAADLNLEVSVKEETSSSYYYSSPKTTYTYTYYLPDAYSYERRCLSRISDFMHEYKDKLFIESYNSETKKTQFKKITTYSLDLFDQAKAKYDSFSGNSRVKEDKTSEYSQSVADIKNRLDSIYVYTHGEYVVIWLSR